MKQDNNGVVPVQSSDMLPTEQDKAISLNQSGDNNTQIGYAKQVINNYHMGLVTQGLNPDGTIRRASTQLSNEYYNLFVLGNSEEFTALEGSFIVSYDRILENPYTDSAIRETFAYMTESDRATIMTYPSLFMTENHNYGKTDDSHFAYLGYVTNISPHGRDTKISYRISCEIPQQRLNELSTELCLRAAKCFNELNRTHWAIKRVNLLEELSEAHIALF